MSEDQNLATQEVADSGTPPTGLHFDDSRAQADQASLQAALADAPRRLGAANAISPIGGQLIHSSGGVVGFCPMGGNPAAIGNPNQVPEFAGWNGGTPTPPALTATNYLDCARWQVEFTPFLDDVTQTMSWAQAVSVTLFGFRARVEVINDIRFVPAMLARYGLINPNVNVNMSFQVGCRMTLVHGNASNYPALSFGDPGGPLVAPDFYWCPSVKLVNPNTVVDAIGKKMVRSMPLELVGNAPIFHLPYENGPLAAYMQHLAACRQGF
jgi:hypothetical protein